MFFPDDGLDFVVRKVGHMAVFGTLALLLWRALSATWSPRPTALALMVTVLYAATDELHQGFVGGRHVSVVDVAIDAIGAVVALVVASRLRARHLRR